MKMKKKAVITGQTGFIGYYLTNYLKYIAQDVDIISFKKEYFEDLSMLEKICKETDIIVHLAGLNRHHNSDEIWRVNIELVEKIITTCEKSNSKPHIIFASSIQENRDTIYGKAKKKGRELFAKWAQKNNALFTGLIIPSVFGPFGKPFYNSVISTFSFQLVNGQEPTIHVDSLLPLIYVHDLAKEFHKIIQSGISISQNQNRIWFFFY